MRALELDAHMRGVGMWVDWNATVDTFKAGDPGSEVKGIAVAWMSLQWALEKAHAAGCNLFVTHEPTFYDHWDRDQSVFEHEHARRKRAFLERTGMVVYRCHDVWDVMPELGIVDSWGRGLALGGRVVATAKFYAVHEREPLTVAALAEHVARQVRPLGQDHVDVLGDPNKVVSRVGVGTGAITNVVQMARLGADALIVTDDGIHFWQGGSWALDAGLPLLVVNHATAEEWGMRALAGYLSEQFPGVPVQHIPQGCMYRTFR
jgi:putative NIF3 family GTP cyclohydrolase 1 type 2